MLKARTLYSSEIPKLLSILESDDDDACSDGTQADPEPACNNNWWLKLGWVDCIHHGFQGRNHKRKADRFHHFIDHQCQPNFS